VALANINAGLLFLMAITSLEVYGVIIAGWASNSKYAFSGRAARFGADGQLRNRHGLLPPGGAHGVGQPEHDRHRDGAGQRHGRRRQGRHFLSWNWLPLLPIFLVYFISGLAETNRHPFDVVEGESEIVAGHMIEYSGMSFAMFFLAEYANMWLVSILAVIMFLGGWLPRLPSLTLSPAGSGWVSRPSVSSPCSSGCARPSRAYRYDQIMRLGWKIFIPVTLVWLVVVGAWMQTPFNIWN
jgi:NADH-quinone oxidoreductase subunit H